MDWSQALEFIKENMTPNSIYIIIAWVFMIGLYIGD
jgi:hypothetical protein